MRDALNATGRPIWLVVRLEQLCAVGKTLGGTWRVGCVCQPREPPPPASSPCKPCALSSTAGLLPSGVRKPRAELCRRADDVNNWGGVMNNALSVDKNLAEYAGPRLE